MRKSLLKIITLPIIFGLISCEKSCLFKMCISTEDSTHISKTYSYFEGSFTHKVSFAKSTDIKVKITTTEGKLFLDISNKNFDNYYSGNFVDNFSFTVTVPEGSYIFTLKANEHSGSYDFSWTR